jgi:NAD dependent epimerase/dehydratase
VSAIDGRAILVTGAGGFIGGHLTAELVRRGARVRAFLRYNSRNETGTLNWFDSDVGSAVELAFGDLRDIESVTRAMKGIDLVFHLGAQIAIPYSYVNPRDFFETNVLGALNVAEGALGNGVEQLVHVSSSEVYGSAQHVPIKEDHPLEPQSPYAASKLGADKLMDSYHRAFGLPVAVVRPFNTYGPHQSARAIVPTIISQALTSDTIQLGSLTPRRDLTYVTDTAAGMIAAAVEQTAVGRTVQLGTGRDVSIAELVELVGQLMGKQLIVREDPQRIRPAASEVDRLLSSPALAKRLIGWEPNVNLRDGLGETIEWIAANRDRYRTDGYIT